MFPQGGLHLPSPSGWLYVGRRGVGGWRDCHRGLRRGRRGPWCCKTPNLPRTPYSDGACRQSLFMQH